MRLLFGVKPGADLVDITALVESLPEGVSCVHDRELNALAVVVNGDARLANETLGLMSRSGLVSASVANDTAIVRYMPHQANRPASWDVLGDDWAVCTTCSWSTNQGIALDERDREMRRHDREVHGGRS